MATEVLYPQDVLTQRFRPHTAAAHHRRKPHPHTYFHHHPHNNHASTTIHTTPNPSSSSSSIIIITCRSTNISNPRPSRKAPAADQKRRRDGSGSPPPKPQHPHLTTLLRRGESLDSALAGASSRSGTLPRKQGPPSNAGLASSARGGDLITATAAAAAAARSSSHPPRPRGDIYAGSAFTVSPAPSDLPLPTSFFSSSSARSPAAVEVGSVDHSATKDLLRLLRLQ